MGTPAPAKTPIDIQKTPVYMAVLNELNVNNDQVQKRQQLIKQIEIALSARYGSANRLISYVLRFGHARTLMNTADIPHIKTLLDSISSADQINVLLHSPGGDGTVVEKMVEMCRSH